MAVPTRSRILIVDDDPVMCAYLQTYLEASGYGVTVTAHAVSALSIAARDGADLLLIDVSMPGVDGLDLCRRLHAAMAVPPPVIFLTAKGDVQARVAGLEAGAVDYVVKPFDVDELVARMRAALRTKAVRDELMEHATRDPLTGLINRREFDARADLAIAHAERYDHALACAMLDIDRFKAINDAHGHAVGDEILREAATRLRETCRTTDTIGRYGGDEFVVLFPDTPLENAFALGERVCAAFVDHTFAAGLCVTVSIGITGWSPEIATHADLYAAADRALYRAKGGGRNRTEPVRVD